MWWLAACSDYKLEPEGEDPSGAAPEVAVSPDAVAEVACTLPATATVEVANEGSATLHVTNLYVEGGWALDAVALPLEIAPGAAHALTLTGEGTGRLYVVTDDADEGTTVVPLDAVGNAPPVVSILSPGPGEVIAEDTLLVVSGEVGDDRDAPGSLAVRWSADTAGELSTAPADSAGLTSFSWKAPDPGTHTLTLSATDTCGATSTATVTMCQDAVSTYDALELAGWHYEGASRYDGTNGWLELTSATEWAVGTAFETSTVVPGGAVSIDFQLYIGGGTGADGLSLTALDVDRASTFLGGSGCGMGYGGDASCTEGPALPGWSLEFDAWYNADADFTKEDHVAFTFDGNVDEPVVAAVLPELEDSGWHHAIVTVAEPRVTVVLDGVTYIDADYPGYFGFPAYVGFTAGTGASTNAHLVDALLVTERACP